MNRQSPGYRQKQITADQPFRCFADMSSPKPSITILPTQLESVDRANCKTLDLFCFSFRSLRRESRKSHFFTTFWSTDFSIPFLWIYFHSPISQKVGPGDGCFRHPSWFFGQIRACPNVNFFSHAMTVPVLTLSKQLIRELVISHIIQFSWVWCSLQVRSVRALFRFAYRRRAPIGDSLKLTSTRPFFQKSFYSLKN
jgi:hypothetical protein